MLKKIILIAIAGGCGALLRYWLSGLVQGTYKGGFPFGTLAVNVAGCFLFGAVWSLAEGRYSISTEMRTVILVGFMGAFTTFSSFAFDTGDLMRESQWGLAATNVLAQNILGVGAFFVGLIVGRLP